MWNLNSPLKAGAIAAAAGLFFLSACGPKEIGSGSSHPDNLTPEAEAADLMRASMTGMGHTQQMLYWQNRPDVMESARKSRLDYYRLKLGGGANPQPPAPLSPFRE